MLDSQQRTEAKPSKMIVPIICLMILVLAPASVIGESPPNFADLEVDQVWKDPAEGGANLSVMFSGDGMKMLLSGYGTPNELRIMGRDMTTITVLEPPADDYIVKGSGWSTTDKWVFVFGRAAGDVNDTFWVYTVHSIGPARDLFENGTLPLSALDSALFMAEDAILAIGGRDGNGSSRLLIFETDPVSLIRDIPSPGDSAISWMGSNGMDLILFDAGGHVTVFSTTDWQEKSLYEGESLPPTDVDVTTLPRGDPWLSSYADGTIRYWFDPEAPPEISSNEYPGAIQALAWSDKEEVYVVAVKDPEGGSELICLQYHNGSMPDERISDIVDTATVVTDIARHPLDPSVIIVGFEDGSIARYHLTLRPNQRPAVSILSPNDGERIEGSFVISGRATDDGGRVDWVKVSFDNGPYKLANGTFEWTFAVDSDEFDQGTTTILVKTYDGFSASETIKITITTPYEGSILEPWPILLMIIAIIVLVLTVRWRRKGLREG